MEINKKDIIEDSNIYYDGYGNEHNIENDIEQAERDVGELKRNVNFRWSEFEIRRAKKIAEKLGMPYQTYIKSTLKQAMDNDEKKFN